MDIKLDNILTNKTYLGCFIVIINSANQMFVKFNSEIFKIKPEKARVNLAIKNI